MKRLKRLTFIAVVLFPSLMAAQSFSVIGDLKYFCGGLNDSTAVVWSCNSKSEKIVIPPYITHEGKKYSVIGIQREVFAQHESLKSVVIPNTIKWIGEEAFFNCNSLQEIVIPNSVTKIGDKAFAFCHSLKELIIPNSVTEIGNEAFYFCDSFKSIVIPNSVINIGRGAFSNCRNLEEIVVPDEAKADLSPDEDGYRHSLFAYCWKIKKIQGNTHPFPKWLIEYMLSYKEDEIVQEDEANSMHGMVIGEECGVPEYLHKWAKNLKENSFSYYAYDRILDKIKVWQQKGEFETTAQWQARVTESARSEYVSKVQEDLKTEFIKEKKKNQASETYNIGTYDADYNTFPISTANAGEFHLQVPIAEAPKVKESWRQAIVLPVYDVVDDHLAITSAEVKVNGRTYTTIARYENATSDIAINLPPLQLNLGVNNTEDKKPVMAQVTDKSLDQSIPTSSFNNTKTFAVIIGNENYKEVESVPYALNDARIFASYCEKTLGIPQKNIKIYENATFGVILSAIENIQQVAKAFQGDINVIFYYAGHGVPNETTNEAYLLPVDANGRNIAACYQIEKLYSDLKALNANQVTVFLDACFSGAQRGTGMLASSRGIAFNTKQAAPQGNMVVFSAASADETAYPFAEKGHGLFTYYLLKKLNETKGNVTLGELGRYICEKVAQESIVTNGKSQTPTVVPSANISTSWTEMKLVK